MHIWGNSFSFPCIGPTSCIGRLLNIAYYQGGGHKLIHITSTLLHNLQVSNVHLALASNHSILSSQTPPPLLREEQGQNPEHYVDQHQHYSTSNSCGNHPKSRIRYQMFGLPSPISLFAFCS
jgi:hypothetical protein